MSSLESSCGEVSTGCCIWKFSGAGGLEGKEYKRCSALGGVSGDIGGPLAFQAGGDWARNGWRLGAFAMDACIYVSIDGYSYISGWGEKMPSVMMLRSTKRDVVMVVNRFK